ncbi:MAG: hypothetical protein HYY26_02345 [Acidobacteria bacterium]|nr:hypothetical protein [Acidobacteriota bacterium]
MARLTNESGQIAVVVEIGARSAAWVSARVAFEHAGRDGSGLRRLAEAPVEIHYSYLERLHDELGKFLRSVHEASRFHFVPLESAFELYFERVLHHDTVLRVVTATIDFKQLVPLDAAGYGQNVLTLKMHTSENHLQRFAEELAMEVRRVARLREPRTRQRQ